MTQLLIPILTFIAVVAFGGSIATVIVQRRRSVGSRLQNLEGGGDDTSDNAAAKAMQRVGAAVSAGRISTRLRQDLTRAGFYGEAASTIYLGTKLSLFVAGLGAFTVLMIALETPLTTALGVILLGAAALFFLPNLIVMSRRRRRSREVQRYLPDAIDLLEVCVSAGMSLDAAWNSVGDEIRHVSAILADEMALTNLEINIGSARAVAMRNMAQRTGAGELTSLVALLVQAERFGTSMAEALREFASSMRETRRQRAEEAAEKMPVKLLFPMVLCLFPVMMIVLVGPAGINLAKVMGGP